MLIGALVVLGQLGLGSCKSSSYSSTTKLWQILSIVVACAKASLTSGVERVHGCITSHLVLSCRNRLELSVVCVRHELVLRIGRFRQELLLG